MTYFSTDIFKFDPDFLENEDKYKEIKRGSYYERMIFIFILSSLILTFPLYFTDILGEGDSGVSSDDDDDDDEDGEDEDEENKGIWMCADDNTLSRGFLRFGVKNVLKFK